MRRKPLSVVFLVLISFIFTSALFTNCSSQFQSQTAQSLANGAISGLSLTNDSDVLMITQRPSVLSNQVNGIIKYSIKPPKAAYVDHVEFQLNNQEWQVAYDNEILLTDLNYGNQKIALRAIGKDGSISQNFEYRWLMDNQKPVVVINSRPDAVISADSQIEFSTVDTSIIATICSVNNQSISNCRSPIPLTNLSVGISYEVKIQVTDSAGNISDPQVVSFGYVSGTKGINLALKPGAFSNSRDATFRFAQTGTGNDLVRYECKLDFDPNFHNCTSDHSVFTLSEGEHEFKVRGFDVNGTASAMTSYLWTVDVTAPTIVFAPPYQSHVKATTDANLDATANLNDWGITDTGRVVPFVASDINSGVVTQCQLLKYEFSSKNCDGLATPALQSECNANPYSLNVFKIVKDYQNCSTNYNFENINSGGVFRFKVRLIDRAGNQSIVASEFRLNDRNVPFVTLNLNGGAALIGNAVVLDSAAQLLPSYDLLGLGSGQNLAPLIVSDMGLNWYSQSGLLSGLNAILSAADKAKVRGYAIANKSLPLVSTNKLNANGIIEKLGRTGAFFPNLKAGGGYGQSTAIYASSATNFINAPENINLAAMMPSGYQNADIRNSDTNLKSLWGVTSNSVPNSSDVVFGSLTLATLSGAIGTAALSLGGYDYRNNDRAYADLRDADAGKLIAKIIKTALLKNQKVVINLTTDGSKAAARSDIPGQGWTASRTEGVQMFFVVDPSLTNNFNLESKYMIGAFTVGQSVDENISVGTDCEKAAAIVACNYSVFNGQSSCAAGINDKLSADEILKTKMFSPK